jgi:hypothetical protein
MRAVRLASSSDVAPPARFVQHLYEPDLYELAPTVSCWFPPPLRLRGVAAIPTVVPDDAEGLTLGTTGLSDIIPRSWAG